MAGGQILSFSIDLLRRPYNTLALPCECVIRPAIVIVQQEKTIWNFDLGEVVRGGYRYKLCSRGRQSWCRRVILQNDSLVPGESEMDVSTLVQYSDLSGPKSNEFVDWVTKAREVTAGVCVSGLSSQTAMKMCLFESLTSQGAQ